MTAASKPTLGRGQVAAAWRAEAGNYVRTLRMDRGITQDELGALMGVNNKKMVSHIETGRVHVPPERCHDLAVALGADTQTFAIKMLRYQNPWLYRDIFGADAKLALELRLAGERQASLDPDPDGEDGQETN